MPKREKARILAAMQQSTQNRGHQRAMATELDDQPRLLAAVLRAHMETCEFTREKVASMRQRARECPSYSLPTMVSKSFYSFFLLFHRTRNINFEFPIFKHFMNRNQVAAGTEFFFIERTYRNID